MGWFSRKSATHGEAGRTDFQPAPSASVSADPLEAALQQRRYGLIARGPAEWRELAAFPKIHAAAVQKLESDFALVPAGLTSIALHVNSEPGTAERDAETRAFLLARCAV